MILVKSGGTPDESLGDTSLFCVCVCACCCLPYLLYLTHANSKVQYNMLNEIVTGVFFQHSETTLLRQLQDSPTCFLQVSLQATVPMTLQCSTKPLLLLIVSLIIDREHEPRVCLQQSHFALCLWSDEFSLKPAALPRSREGSTKREERSTCVFIGACAHSRD